MKRKRLGLYLLIPLGVAGFFAPFQAGADLIDKRQVDLYAEKLGVAPDMDTFCQDSDEGATRFSADVTTPCKLADLGFKGLRKGDRVEIISMQNGTWKVKSLSSGRESTFPLELGWDKEG